MLKLPESPPRIWPRFRADARGIALTARVGRILGICFGICFVTGLLSHYQYGPWRWLPIPAAPVWGYRLTQGLHVITGVSLIPLLLIKLWSVFPRLFAWPPVRGVVHGLERLSVAVLASSAIIEVTTGFLNVLNWYPWAWSFVNVHFWLAWVTAGSILLHIAVQLPVIRRGLAEPLAPQPGADHHDGISRRGVLIAGGASVGLVALVTAGQVVPALEPVGLLTVRRPDEGPQHVPINRTAEQAKVTTSAYDTAYRLKVTGPKPYDLDLSTMESLPAAHEAYPITCVEGWSASASWTGPRLIDLVRRAGGNSSSRVRVVSLERGGAYGNSIVEGPHLTHALLATHLNGERIDLDHGYPLRLIAPDRPGVLQTKWVTRVEIL